MTTADEPLLPPMAPDAMAAARWPAAAACRPAAAAMAPACCPAATPSAAAADQDQETITAASSNPTKIKTQSNHNYFNLYERSEGEGTKS